MMKEAFLASWEDMVYVGDNPEKDFYIGRDFPIMTVRIVRMVFMIIGRTERDTGRMHVSLLWMT